MKEKLGISFHNSRALNQKIDALPGLAQWEHHTLRLNDEESAPEIELWCRNPVDALRSLWANPALLQFMKFAPERQFSDDEMDCRLYNEVNTCNWWWEKQVGYVFETQ